MIEDYHSLNSAENRLRKDVERRTEKVRQEKGDAAADAYRRNEWKGNIFGQVGGLSGAAAGAVIGSAVPIVGTAIGAVVGCIAGAVAGKKLGSDD